MELIDAPPITPQSLIVRYAMGLLDHEVLGLLNWAKAPPFTLGVLVTHDAVRFVLGATVGVLLRYSPRTSVRVDTPSPLSTAASIYCSLPLRFFFFTSDLLAQALCSLPSLVSETLRAFKPSPPSSYIAFLYFLCIHGYRKRQRYEPISWWLFFTTPRVFYLSRRRCG